MRPPRRRRRRILSPLTRRILFLNLVGPALLGIGFLYLDDYRSGLIDAQLAALRMQARIVATAVSETARPDDDGEAGLDYRLAPEILRPVLFRLMQPADGHARIFAPEGHVLADSRIVSPYGGRVLVEPLPPPRAPPSWPMRLADDLYDGIVALVPARAPLSVWPDAPEPRAEDFAEVAAALAGETSSALRSFAGGAGMLITVAAPVQRFKQVMGAVMLIASGEQIEASVRALRYDIVKLCLAAMLVTALASLYIARTITLPILRLAAATERVRRSRAIGGRRGAPSAQAAIPDMRARRDEIGDLSGALVEMTAALSQRIDEIERFAADVAHEIKNPLTSLKSAVETAARVADPARREKLMQIIVEDVQRIDRLLGDISGAHPMRGLEAEIAFRLGKDLPPRARPYTMAEVRRAVASVHPAVEIVSSRWTDWLAVGLHSVVADHGANGALVVGRPLSGGTELDLDRLEVEMRVDGATVGKGTGAAVIGGPHGSLLWLANLLRRRGGLKAGEYVSTGTCTGLVKAPADAAVVALYAGKPRVSFRFV